MNMRYLLHLTTIVITALLIISCDQDSTTASKQKSKAHLVATEELKLESSTIKRRFNAHIFAPNTIRVSNQIAATIMSMPFRAGDVVSKGDVLIQLDSKLTKAEYLKALANLEKATQDLNRINKLIPKQLASAEQLSTTITDKKLAEAEVTLKKIQLDRSIIKAPFSGVISQRFFEPGDTAPLNSHLITLVDHHQLLAKSAIPESFVAYVPVNKAVRIKIPALSLTLDGMIKTLYPTVDSSTQQITIEVSFSDIKTQLFPGQFAELIIPYETTKKILIPVNTVQYDTKGTWVYTVDTKNNAQQTRITTGQHFNSKIEASSGLSNGDTLITKGFIGLRIGKSITTKKHSIKKIKQ